MALPLESCLKIGVNTMLRRTEPATGPWMPTLDELVEVVQQVDRLGFNSFWCGDHVAFAIPFLDPITQIAQAAVVSKRLTFGTAVFLLPLRHPTPVAKQIATLDHLTGGRFVFGVGIGGEFPKEYEGCGVPLNERGPRLSEGIEVIRKLWTGETVSHEGRFYSFKDVKMTPAPRQPGGPPIWCGGRSEPALRRAARLADGWFSYAVSPEMFAKGLATIEAAAQEAGRKLERFGTAHLMFTRIGDSYERALRRGGRVAERALRHEHAPCHRALRRHRHACPGGREDPRIPCSRRPPPEPRSGRSLRAARRTVRALRGGGASAHQGLDGMSEAHMTFGFSEEQRQMRASVLGLLNRVLPPAKIRALDKAGEYPFEAHKSLADAGYMGLMYPTEFGGMGGSYMDLAVLGEALGYHYGGIAQAYGITVIYAGMHIALHGSDEMKREVLPKIISGDMRLALCLSEPNHGSDVAGIELSAVRDGNGYVLNGQKIYNSAAHVAHNLVVVARPSPAAATTASACSWSTRRYPASPSAA